MRVVDALNWEESVWDPELVHLLGWDKGVSIHHIAGEITINVLGVVDRWGSVPLELEVSNLLRSVNVVNELDIDLLGWNVLHFQGSGGTD